MVAQSDTESINISYLPIVDKQPGDMTSLAAPHITALFVKESKGRFKLQSLDTLGEVWYHEKDGNQFFGTDSMHFNADTSLMEINSRKNDPCLVNGTSVNRIEYDMYTGKIVTEFSTESSDTR